MNLLEEIRAANEKAKKDNPAYKTPVQNGFGVTGSDLVWNHLPLEAQEKWVGLNLATDLLIDPEQMATRAMIFGVDLTNV